MRLNINKKTDERLQRIQESLSAIRIIKMYTWEKFFGHKIDEARKKEMKEMMKAFYLRTVMVIITLLSSKIGFYALVMTYIWFNGTASAEVMFYIMKCFETLKHTIAHSVSHGMSRLAELSASLNRIDAVLAAEELNEKIEEPTSKPKVHLKDIKVCIKDKIVLQNITLTIQGGLNVVTGQLGSGKSSLIKVILNDYPVDEGIVETIGRKSYASQDPWLFPSSIKQNILFGEVYDEGRYQEVVRVCALKFDFSLFPRGDETIIADRGLNLSKGQQARINLARTIYKESDIYLIDDSLTALDSLVQDFIFSECIRGFLKNKLCVLVTHNNKHISNADHVIVLDNGRVEFQGKEPNISKDILAAIEESDIHKTGGNEKEKCESDADETTQLLTSDTLIKRRRVYHEINKEGSVSAEVYSKYFKFGGGIFLFSLVIIMYIGSQFIESYISKLLTNWVNIQQNITNVREANATSFIEKVTVSTGSISNEFIRNVTSEFYDLTINTTSEPSNDTDINYNVPSIETLELKSDETLNMYSMMIASFVILELMKYYLILKFARNASALFSIGGIIILIAVVNWRFFIPSLTFIGFLILLRNFYMPAARSIKRLESATRSPIVGHLNASMEGLTTIRASKAQDILTYEFDRHQDVYTSAHYTSFCIKRAFGFYMDLFSTLFLSIIVGRFLFFDLGTSAGDVGLAITQAASLSMISQKCLILWTELENYMTSVERVLEYTHLETEHSEGLKIENWPCKGEIKYMNVCLTYTNTNERVLKDISFVVKSKQKIGIVGRTGAGKSSIISTLFRLYNYEGKIIVDEVDIKTLSLKFLRQHISIIPQDPIMFAGTVRSNIDPLQRYSDEEIWKTIHKIHLENIIPSLDLKITDNNSNFSTGQRQLIYEATANMDPETDILIQKAIVDNFSGCTVFVIAHRLHSVLDCHKVMVMDKGEIREFDNPFTLMEDKSSMFSKMLNNSGLSDTK
ncbi:hypothetical protein NQ314_009842 [Rhamnusium bicolor]|uniref:Multidrug resistance-associated protein lethal(2)03659 n=1 Tax=Rhamnusium bicolor TaxID=1586634 RepID=A0AAV8XWH2_9CUCU|nr:hypothetical protein NQ314_009842 [Rhamnusium bicolor]